MRKLQCIAKLLITISVVWFIGCDDFLSTLPDNRTTLDSPEKISNLLTSAYPQSHHALFTESMSDNAADKGSQPAGIDASSIRVNELSYAWEDINFDANESDSPAAYWVACYEAIAHANHALKAIEDAGSSPSLNPKKGEALLARAYSHFMLVNLWAKHYNPETSAKDLGVPYELEPETVAIKTRKRNTVKEVYDLIEKDINEGLRFLKNEYENPKFHFTLEAAKAFATRFYLYTGEWEQAIRYASAILDAEGVNLRDWTSNYYAGRSYDEIAVHYSSSIESANLLVASTNSVYARNYANCRYGFTNSLQNEIMAKGDKELIPYNQSGEGWAYQIYGPEIYRNIPKFEEYFKYTNISAGIGYAYASFVLLSYDEVWLNRAEAYAMTNQFDLARTDMKLFLSKKANFDLDANTITEERVVNRYPPDKKYQPYYPLSSLQESHVKAIAELRRREFLQEGLRWFDIRRFGIEVAHAYAGRDTIMLKINDPRRVLQIPSSAVALGLEENPR